MSTQAQMAIRVVKVKTPKGTFKHPIAKICPLLHVKNELQFHHNLGGAGMFMQGTNLLNLLIWVSFDLLFV